MGFPYPREFSNMLHSNLIKNLPDTNNDINIDNKIYEPVSQSYQQINIREQKKTTNTTNLPGTSMVVINR